MSGVVLLCVLGHTPASAAGVDIIASAVLLVATGNRSVRRAPKFFASHVGRLLLNERPWGQWLAHLDLTREFGLRWRRLDAKIFEIVELRSAAAVTAL